ncbi:MAG: arsenical efflux pump membrane protein ArsB [Thermoplasmataceae archaeon]|jgi:arsenical pump membrane protein
MLFVISGHLMIYFYLVSIAIFILTLYFVERNPRGMGIGYPAIIGAFACIAIGITPISDLLVIWDIVWNSTFTFVAIVIFSLTLDEAGFFEYMAIKFTIFSKGNTKLLFVLIIVFGAIVSALFANDGAILVLTPVVYSILKRTNAEGRIILPFIMAVGFIADTASSPFIISNLVNIITTSYFSISFIDYALVMMFPAFVSTLASLSFLFLYYRKSLDGRLDISRIPDPVSVIKDPKIFRIAMPLTIFLIVVYAVTGIFDIPIAFVAVPAVSGLFLYAHRNGRINTRKILVEAPWQVVYFSLGMFVIVFGMGREGLTYDLSFVLVKISYLGGILSTVLSGFLFSVLAGLLNNLPSVMIGNLAIKGSHLGVNLAYANVIGNDIGPKFTPIGSLATLLWIYSLERRGDIKINKRYYMKVGFILTVPVLLVTLLALTVMLYL